MAVHKQYLCKHTLLKLSLLASIGVAASLQPLAAANLVQNSDFEQNGGLGVLGNGVNGGTNGKTTLANWTIGPTIVNSITNPGDSPFVFVMDGNASKTGAPSQNGTIYLRGSVPASPNGGYFIGADGDYAPAPIMQTIAGLAPSTTYTLSFDWGASQLTACDNIGTPCPSNSTTNDWQVSIDGQTFTTPTTSVVNGVFTGWKTYSTTFTTGSSIGAGQNVLSFLSQGGPVGAPPFALLDSVSLTQTPEPASLSVIAGGLLSLIGVVRLRKNRRR